MAKPPAVHPGARIGVIAPASSPSDPDRFAAGCEYLQDRGYDLVRGRARYDSRGYLSGSDTDRLEELAAMIERDDISALFCARGGYGTLRLLREIDYAAIRRHSKLIVGYSDITALQLALCARTELPSISGPMIASDWHSMNPASEKQFWELAAGVVPHEIPLNRSNPVTYHTPGTVTGTLIAGNLSVLTRLLGTPYLPSFENTILCIEDIGEPPYRIDGMLAALRLAGVFDQINGMIFGQFTDSTPEEDKPSLTLAEVIEDYRPYIKGPVISNADYGHTTPFTSVPIGVEARLTVSTSAAELTVTEPVVRI